MRKVFLLPLLVTVLCGCNPDSQEASRIPTPEELSAIKLTQVIGKTDDERAAVAAVKAIVVARGDHIENYYLGPITERGDKTIELPLYDQEVFKSPNPYIGGMVGWSRLIVYDPKIKKVTKVLRWE